MDWSPIPEPASPALSDPGTMKGPLAPQKGWFSKVPGGFRREGNEPDASLGAFPRLSARVAFR